VANVRASARVPGQWPRGVSALTEDQFSFDEAIRVLCNHALVEADATLGDSVESLGYSMHSCVHSWTEHVVNERWDNRLANLAISCVSSHVPDQSRSQYWVTDRRLVGHSDRCLVLIRSKLTEKDDSIPMPTAMRNLGVHYRKQGRLREAEEMYNLGLKRCGMGQDTLAIDMLNNLGNLFLESGRLAEAEETYQQALDKSEETLSQDHTLLFRSVNHLGICSLRQGSLDKATIMFERALEGRESACGPNHLSTLETAHNLGELYSKQGKNAEAEDMLLWALKGRERELGADHTLTLETVGNLSNLYSRQKNLGKAKKMLWRALKGFEQAFGPNHTSTLHAANSLGLLYMQQHRLV
jgi:hypothetical protein